MPDRTTDPDLGGAESGLDEPPASHGVWDLVLRELSRRWAFRIGFGVLVLLYGVAIYAPLIANDRPYVLEAIDVGEYEGAVRSISAVTSSVVRLLEQDPEEYAAARGELAPPTLDAALDAEEAAARARIAVLERTLVATSRGPLEAYESLLDKALRASDEGDRENALQLGQEARAKARELRRSLALDAVMEGGTVELRGSTRYPLLESLAGWEVFWMVLWAWLLGAPVWSRLVDRFVLAGDPVRIRAARGKKCLAAIGVSSLFAAGWSVAFADASTELASGAFKEGLTKGDIVLELGSWRAARRPVFAPLAMGYAETHPAEGFRPPTWTRSAELDPEGRYVHGIRQSTPDVMGIVPPANPVEVRFGEPPVNSGLRHPAGTDELGRDFLVRIIWGSRVSLSVGILSALLLTLIGVAIGSVAGYLSGPVDTFVMRAIEILQSIPAFFLIIVAMAFTDPSVVPPIVAIVVVIAIIRWTAVARLVRGEFLRLREAEFVVAARALGYSNRRIILRHLLPNAMGPILVSAAFAVAAGILTESAVSYLGFGIQHPGASWGSLVNESKSADHWWVQVFPGLLIFLTVTCYNVVGDAIRDALDPKMRLES